MAAKELLVNSDLQQAHSLMLLQPLCTALIHERTPENVAAIAKTLSKVDKSTLEKLQVYIVFPLKATLSSQPMNEGLLLSTCGALTKLFEVSGITSVTTFLDVFDPLLSLLAPAAPSDYHLNSEETKVAVIDLISVLWRMIDCGFYEHLYQLPYMPAYGQLVSSLLAIAEKEKSRNVQVSALKCLKSAISPKDDLCKEVRLQIGSLFSFIVPGVTISITRIITGDTKRGHAVFVEAINILGKVIELAVGNEQINSKQESVFLPSKMNVEQKRQLSSLVVIKDEEWIKETSAKLKIVLEQCFKALQSNSHFAVSLEVIKLVNQLLSNCSKALKSCLPVFLEAVVSLMMDPQPEVSEEAKKTFQNQDYGEGKLKDEASVTEILQDNLYQLTTALPRHIRMADEDEKIHKVKLLNGYLNILGGNINKVLLSSAHLERLCLSLIHSLELDVSVGTIVEENMTKLSHDKDLMERDTSDVWLPRRHFKHFRKDEVWTELSKACRLLGQYGDVVLLVDRLLNLYRESLTYRLAASLVINEVILGTKEQHSPRASTFGDIPSSLNRLPDVQDAISLVLEEYLQEGNLKLPDLYDVSNLQPPNQTSLLIVKTSYDEDVKRSRANRNRAVLLLGLFMEGIAKFNMVLGQDFETHFIKALYPVVENLGHEILHISHTAYYTLKCICTTWSFTSVDSLLQTNADYLMNSVSLRLRHFSQHKRCPQTISVMLRFCSSELLPRIQHSVGQLMDTLDERYVEDLLLFLPVLLELAVAIGRWNLISSQGVTESSNPYTTQTSSEECDNELRQVNSDCVISFVKDYLEQKHLAETFEDTEENGGCDDKEKTLEAIKEKFNRLKMEEKGDEDPQNEDGEEDEEEEDINTTDKCPLHLQVVKDILLRVKHFLSSSDVRVQVLSVDILCQCFIDLSASQKQLLPQLHQTWPGFCLLFHSERKVVVLKALKALTLMAELSGDFLQHRILKEVFPGLLSFLHSQARISSNCRPGYLHTVNFKLQKILLNSFGSLSTWIQLDGRDLYKVATACLTYLGQEQPLDLVQACKKAFASFIALDRDAMWLLLGQHGCPYEYVAPGPEFVPVKFPDSFCQDVKENVAELFKAHFGPEHIPARSHSSDHEDPSLPCDEIESWYSTEVPEILLECEDPT